MKKVILSLMAMAAIFTSCNNEELNNVANENAIQFDGFVNKSTRSDNDLTNASLTNFSVYGFMETAKGIVFEGETVRKEDGNWTYDNTQYWFPGKSYYFAAIAPSYGRRWSYDTNNTTDGGIITFENGNGTQDLIFANTKKYDYNKGGQAPVVGFDFYHLLSRVSFSFTNNFNNSMTTLNVKDVKIKNAVNTASIDMAKATTGWKPATENLLSFGNSNNPRIPQYESSATGNKYMIPVAKSYELEFTVEVYVGEELAGTYTRTATIENMNFFSNKSYVLNADLDHKNIDPEGGELEEIKFEITDVNGWNETM